MKSFLEYLVFFRAVFSTEQVSIISRINFEMFHVFPIFDPKWGFCMGYSLCMVADFQNGLISRIFSVLGGGLFAQNNAKSFLEWIFTRPAFLIFDPKWGFCMGYSLCMKACFQNGLISRILTVFWNGFFAQNNCKLFVDCILTCFLEF